MQDLIEFLARALVDDPEAIRIHEVDNGFELEVAPGDVGRVIGRRGKTARALRTILAAAGGGNLEILSPDEDDDEDDNDEYEDDLD